MKAYAQSLDALGDSTRRAVFESLRRGPRSVGDIAARMPVSRPAVSQHLKVLKDAGLVIERPEGTRRLYAIDPGGLTEVRAYLETFWTHALARFAAAAAHEAKRNEGKPTRRRAPRKDSRS